MLLSTLQIITHLILITEAGGGKRRVRQQRDAGTYSRIVALGVASSGFLLIDWW